VSFAIQQLQFNQVSLFQELFQLLLSKVEVLHLGHYIYLIMFELQHAVQQLK